MGGCRAAQHWLASPDAPVVCVAHLVPAGLLSPGHPAAELPAEAHAAGYQDVESLEAQVLMVPRKPQQVHAAGLPLKDHGRE
jgi:hypothetical protein